jgi:hypothetical protein
MGVAVQVPSAPTANTTNDPNPTPGTPNNDNTEESASLKNEAKDDEAAKPDRGFRFWAIIATLCVIGILSSLENTVVTTSLPYIVQELDLGENYIWITNVFFLTR